MNVKFFLGQQCKMLRLYFGLTAGFGIDMAMAAALYMRKMWRLPSIPQQYQHAITPLAINAFLACETQNFASLLWWEADIMIGFLLICLMAAGRDGSE